MCKSLCFDRTSESPPKPATMTWSKSNPFALCTVMTWICVDKVASCTVADSR